MFWRYLTVVYGIFTYVNVLKVRRGYSAFGLFKILNVVSQHEKKLIVRCPALFLGNKYEFAQQIFGHMDFYFGLVFHFYDGSFLSPHKVFSRFAFGKSTRDLLR